MTGRGFVPRRTATGLAMGAAAIAVVTGVIALLRQLVDPLGLPGLYLFAILPVAIVSGLWLAGIVTLVSFLTFEFFFVPPVHSIRIADPDTGAALAISLVTAYVVSELARRAHERAGEARLRTQEAEAAERELRRLADRAAALRRVATLVAREVTPSKVFDAVTREVALQCDADIARLERFERDGTVTVVAAWSRSATDRPAVGIRFPLSGAGVAGLVATSGRPARLDSSETASDPIARENQALDVRSSVGCPIVVGGRTWGVIAASTRREARFPPHTESAIADFTELVATAILNAESQRQLTASRARLVTEADAARRRIVRDLHDGAQQRLVHSSITLGLAQRELRQGDGAAALIAEALAHVQRANEELRALAHGILPADLTRGGLRGGVDAVVERLDLDVAVDLPPARFPAQIEASAYFIVAEALTNTVKHARAQSAAVTASVDDNRLQLEIRDDGVGGANPDGRGLTGLKDRVTALGGRFSIESPAGGGTVLTATLPIAVDAA
jgi:signal transduction histidine kinase